LPGQEQDINNIKESVLANQKLIEQLNEELNRKTREVRIIQEISSEINTTLDLNLILKSMFLSLDRTFGFRHSMVLLLEDDNEALRVVASHGYEDAGIGAKVKVGQGVIGVVAKRKKIMRIGNIGAQLAYVNTVKTNMAIAGQEVKENVKLPGLANVQSQVAIPLLSEDQLIGVLAVESEQMNVFDERDEQIITILSNQAATAIKKARLYMLEQQRLAELRQAHEELKQLNESLEQKVIERTVEVVQQKEVIEEKNASILSSIRYALRIQNALLPLKTYLKEHVPDSFIIYKPKDIVSGDFYWINKKDNKLFFAAIDCTGHGVPGAFVSIVAHSNLQRTLHVFSLKQPAKMLDKIAEAVDDLFSRGGYEDNIKDGMDIALCALDTENMSLEFSGANNPIYVVRSGELIEVKGDKQPIGHYEYRKPFTNHEMKVEKGDIIYLFSDGFADQFGGPWGKKFKYAQMKELFLSVCNKPMSEQQAAIEKAFYEWKGDNEQVDDICILGVRV
jgi:serine phosphatase RsbU (regulator of sigma subunit)